MRVLCVQPTAAAAITLARRHYCCSLVMRVFGKFPKHFQFAQFICSEATIYHIRCFRSPYVPQSGRTVCRSARWCGGRPPPSPTRNFSKVFSRLALDVTLATTGYYERICRVSHPGHVTVFGQSRPPFPSSEFIHKFTVKVY